MANLTTPGMQAAIARRIENDIATHSIQKHENNAGHRNHLGASEIGQSCSRKLWYIFRWCFSAQFKVTDPKTLETDLEKTHINKGRMMRLFNRGHDEEPRIIEYVKGIGAQVWAHDTNGEQFRISGVLGHFGGSLDGICRLPDSYGIDEPLLLEFKTNGSHYVMKDLAKDGTMVKVKSQHYAQMCCYGSEPKYNLKHALYILVNKSDDVMYVEIVALNHNIGKQMRAKAEQIILAREAPPRISDNPTYWECKFCDAFEICHKNALPERNCRSCVNVQPVEDAQWFCHAHNSVIPKDFIPKACPTYRAVTQIRRK